MLQKDSLDTGNAFDKLKVKALSSLVTENVHTHQSVNAQNVISQHANGQNSRKYMVVIRWFIEKIGPI